ncbi:MAG: DUF2341 domain-containing protein [Archangium sp.]
MSRVITNSKFTAVIAAVTLLAACAETPSEKTTAVATTKQASTLAGWSVGKRYLVTHNASGAQNLSDFQVRFLIDTATEIAAGRMRSDCGDLRVYAGDGCTPTDAVAFWVADGTCNTSQTNVWLKLPSVVANTSTPLSMFWGNPSATSVSDGPSVFPTFFDDFNAAGSTMDSVKWNVFGPVSRSNGYATTAGGAAGFWSKNKVLSAGQTVFGVRTDAQSASGADIEFGAATVVATGAPPNEMHWSTRTWTGATWMSYDYSYVFIGRGSSPGVCTSQADVAPRWANVPGTTTFFQTEFFYEKNANSSITYGIYDKNGTKLQVTLGSAACTMNTTESAYWQFDHSGGAPNPISRVDYTYVRKYANPDPVIVPTGIDLGPSSCLAQGQGPCTPANEGSVCQTVNCSVSGICMPNRADACNVDADCNASSYCEQNTWTCRTKLANGTALPTDGLHDTCSSNLNASCSSGQCNSTTTTCSSANGGACTSASMCTSNRCSANSTCIAMGTCAVTADCASGETCSGNACVVLPGVDASNGTTTYDATGADVVIDPAVNVVGSQNLTGATVTIGTGFVAAQDRLVYSTINGITGSYNTTTGILTLSGSATSAAYQDALRTVKYSNIGGASPNTAARVITFAIGSAVANGSNGHFYEYVSFSGTWTSAKNNAATRSYLGLAGYLATLTSAAENDFVRQKLTNDGWIGAQANPEGSFPRTWSWVTGPDTGTAFCYNSSSAVCSPINGGYSNWASGEPNNAGSEGCGQIYFANSGKWNDLPCNSSVLAGYVIEYGGTATDPVMQLTDTQTVQVRARTSISLTSSQSTQTAGSNVTFTATFSPSAATGSAQFIVDGVAFGSPVTISGGVASLSTSALPVGAHTVDVSYAGDTQRQPATASLSGGVIITTIPAGSGPCNAGNQATVCASGQCNLTTGTCANSNGTSCTAANQCVSNRCGSNGQCGTTNGGACTTGSDCQSGACSPNANSCIPSGGCAVTADCGAGQQCNAGTLMCETAPGIDASSGTAIYDAMGSDTIIDPAITVVGAQNIVGATVTIGTGFVAAQDRLVYTAMNGISGSYNTSTGILTLSGSAPSSDYQAALRTVKYSNTAGALPVTALRTITFAIGSAVANGANGHFYEYVSFSGTWTQARNHSVTRTYLGLRGYLATLTSAAENDFVRQKLTNDGWIGAQANPEGSFPRTWSWVTGPETGTAFCSNPSSAVCNAINGGYSNWAGGEPNNAGNEGCGQIYFVNSGRWNDLPCNVTVLAGYVIEYGGTAGDPVLTLSDTKPLQVRARTVIGLSASQSSAPLHTSISFTATFSPSASTGTAQFIIDGQPYGAPVTITGGAASISTSTLPLGSHTVDVSYAGDTQRQAATASLNGGVIINTISNGSGPCDVNNAATDCTSGVCSASGTCGYAVNEGPCTPGASSLCQSGVCSVGGSCMPSTPGGCFVDGDCAVGSYCDRSSNACTTTLASGQPIPSDGLHDGTCQNGMSAACSSGTCNVTSNTCATLDGTGCTSNAQCVSNTCAPSGSCVPSTAGSCWADGDCMAGQFCNRGAFTCQAQLPAGAMIPVDGLHTGMCASTTVAPACASGRCNATTNTCAAPVGQGCGSGSECEFNTCSQGTCGFSNGESGCTGSTAYLCQSGACSTSGACIPGGANGCFIDTDCAANEYCDRANYHCVNKGLAGAALPNDGLHDGVCAQALADAACLSGACNAVTNTCAAANGQTCTSANECVTNICGGDGQCGHSEGEGPCTAQDAATVCQSGFCNTAANGFTSACIPTATSCWVDDDCGASEYCARNTFTCTPKAMAGTSLPADGLHDTCVGDVSSACSSGLCNATTNTCALANDGTCAAANECVTNVCGMNGECGLADGEPGCTAQSGASLCQSGACTASNVCAPPGGCFVDDDCAASQYCDRTTLLCHAKLLAGTAIPADGLHTGACDMLGAATCASGQCNATTDTCAAGKSVSCATDSQCVSNQCGANGKCDLAEGQSGCTVADPSACQSSTCSSAGVCVPAMSGSCWVDGDCAASQHCRRDQLSCVADGQAGSALVSDTLHDGVCSNATAAAVCVSGKCNPAKNTCALANDAQCTMASECVVDVCGSNGECGFADGQEGCTASTAQRCQSSTCSTSGTCMPAMGCWVDGDCADGQYCDRSTTTCRARLGSGETMPNDGLHDGQCTEANATALCQSGHCNVERSTCAVINSDGCTSNDQCESNLCGPDGKCGAADGAACTSDAICRNGCVDGFCANSDPGVLTGAGGCSQSGGGTSGALWLLVAGALFFARRSRRAVGAVLGLVLFLAVPARAQTSSSSSVSQGAAVDTFRGSAPGSDWFSTDSLDFRGTVRPAARVMLNWGHGLLVVRNDDGSLRSTPVENQLWLNAGAGVTLFDRVRVFANVPVAVAQGGTASNFGGQPLSANGGGIGDLGFGADVRIFGSYGSAFSLAAGVTMTAPSGQSSRMLGDGVASVQPRVMAAGQAGMFVWAAQAGFNVRGASIGSVNFGNELRFAASAGVKVLDQRLTVGPEFFAVAPVTSSGTSRTFGLEGDLGAHFAITPNWKVGAGVGTGLVNAVGVPDFRALASLDWTMGAPSVTPLDEDHDGVADLDDACPHEIGLASQRGCAAPADDDRDGIANAMDLCPNQATFGHADPKRAGCPAAEDADGDGVPDSEDQCRDLAPVGPMNPKKPGCPDRDSDHDGVLESLDECPAQAAGAQPDPAHPGCPLPDADGDTVPDALDQCPNEKGVPSMEKSGCPGLVRLEDDLLLTNSPVPFAPGTATLLPKSFPVLESVKNSILAMPSAQKVIVEGHTDSQGQVATNQALSQKRAEAVRSWLIAHGIDAGRLEARGFGMSRLKVVDEKTAADREANRRVEFRLESR